MINQVTEKTKIDPSEIRQTFSDVYIKLLCCRYWVLEEWECFDLSVPFWRIYHNNISGAKIRFNGNLTKLHEKVVIIIPPNTTFSTELKGDKHDYESINGRKINRKDSLTQIEQKRKVDHLFIHFSLGFPLDFVQTGIYVIPCDENVLQIINAIQEACMEDTFFSFSECLCVKQLIHFSILKLDSSIWKFGNIDHRIFAAMKYIDKNYNEKITNEILAEKSNMAVNSFARLFKTSAGISVQQYIIKLKIEASCNLMHHSDKTID